MCVCVCVSGPRPQRSEECFAGCSHFCRFNFCSRAATSDFFVFSFFVSSSVSGRSGNEKKTGKKRGWQGWGSGGVGGGGGGGGGGDLKETKTTHSHYSNYRSGPKPRPRTTVPGHPALARDEEKTRKTKKKKKEEEEEEEEKKESAQTRTLHGGNSCCVCVCVCVRSEQSSIFFTRFNDSGRLAVSQPHRHCLVDPAEPKENDRADGLDCHFRIRFSTPHKLSALARPGRQPTIKRDAQTHTHTQPRGQRKKSW